MDQDEAIEPHPAILDSRLVVGTNPDAGEVLGAPEYPGEQSDVLRDPSESSSQTVCDIFAILRDDGKHPRVAPLATFFAGTPCYNNNKICIRHISSK